MRRLLDRYILGDLLRVIGLTTAVLVTVIAFGAAIKPLADDNLLTAAQTAKYIALAIVPMLQFALPFAGGFAATMVMHRMTADNEIQAIAVGGVSYRRILLPVAVLGVVLALVMVLLTQWVIPKFWRLMERTIAADMTRMFQASIERGMPFELGDVQIFADKILVDAHPEDTDADTRLVLWRVAAAELDRDGVIVTDVTAAQAVLDIYRRGGRTYLKLRLRDAVAFNSESGELVRAPQLEPRKAIVVPSAFEDDPRFMTQGELLRLYAEPDEFGSVSEARLALAESRREIELRRLIDAELESGGSVELVEVGSVERDGTGCQGDGQDR